MWRWSRDNEGQLTFLVTCMYEDLSMEEEEAESLEQGLYLLSKYMRKSKSTGVGLSVAYQVKEDDTVVTFMKIDNDWIVTRVGETLIKK